MGLAIVDLVAAAYGRRPQRFRHVTLSLLCVL
jgi:hypothetical protein